MTTEVMILTGHSGSGKSTAVRALEDHGYFCVDNIPTALVERLLDVVEAHDQHNKVGLVMDIREGAFLPEAPALIARLRRGARRIHMVFLEAKEEVLLRRYSETRRVHPLDAGAGLRAAISAELQRMAPLRELCDEALDTSSMSPHALRRIISERYGGVDVDDALRVSLLSFGFKHGVPLEADMVLDVRFLPNPYFVAELRELTGLNAQVRDFVLRIAEAQSFLQQIAALLTFLVPQYQREGKRYLTVAIGCTGGRHRSVAIATELGARLTQGGFCTTVRHRDSAAVAEHKGEMR